MFISLFIMVWWITFYILWKHNHPTVPCTEWQLVETEGVWLNFCTEFSLLSGFWGFIHEYKCSMKKSDFFFLLISAWLIELNQIFHSEQCKGLIASSRPYVHLYNNLTGLVYSELSYWLSIELGVTERWVRYMAKSPNFPAITQVAAKT